ncbi:hypothetical protein D3C79_761700 [compost metagenome]
MKLGVMQILRCALERVEKRAGQRREYRLPAQQAEQAVKQAVLDIMHLPAALPQVQLHGLLDTQGGQFGRQLQLDQADLRLGSPWLRRPAQLALQTRQHPRQGLDLKAIGRLPGNL